MNKFMQQMLDGSGDQFGHSSSQQPLKRMFVLWLHSFFEIGLCSSPDLNLGLDLEILLFRTNFRYKCGSSLHVFDMCSFRILMLVSLYGYGDEGVESKRSLFK